MLMPMRKFANDEDENCSYPLVFEILRYRSKRNSPIRIVNARIKSVCHDLLPRACRTYNKSISTVTVEFLLHFNFEEHIEIQEALNP